MVLDQFADYPIVRPHDGWGPSGQDCSRPAFADEPVGRLTDPRDRFAATS